jgi:hypothetical protein
MKTAIQNCADKILKIPTLSISDTAIIINILANAIYEEKQNLIDAFEHNPKVTTNEKGALISIPGIDYYNEKYRTTNKETLK